MGLRFDFDLGELRGVGDRLHREVLSGLQRSARVAQESAMRAAKADAPVRTGELQRSIRANALRVASNSVQGFVTLGVVYGKYVVEGTRPHPVAPVRANALHWVVGGKSFFSKGHMVKGIKPNPFLSRACQVASRVLEQATSRATDEAISRAMK